MDYTCWAHIKQTDILEKKILDLINTDHETLREMN